MIRTYNTLNGPKVKFRGSTKVIKQDLIRIMWSMIEHDGASRQALVEAVEEVNFAVKHIENGVSNES